MECFSFRYTLLNCILSALGEVRQFLLLKPFAPPAPMDVLQRKRVYLNFRVYPTIIIRIQLDQRLTQFFSNLSLIHCTTSSYLNSLTPLREQVLRRTPSLRSKCVVGTHLPCLCRLHSHCSHFQRNFCLPQAPSRAKVQATSFAAFQSVRNLVTSGSLLFWCIND